MVVVRDHSTIAESTSLYVRWREYGFLAECQMKKR
jgi:hypothetical protein